MTAFEQSADDILRRLDELRAADAPTHGGHVLSYVYDSGLAELDELAARAVRAVQPVNGLDPTTFSSVATLEREVIGFVRGLVHGDQADGDQDVVGTVTTGGTESCLLAVKTARDAWLAARGLEPGAARPRLVAPITVHAAFQKAAHYFGLELDLVPVEDDGAVAASAIADRLGDDVALVVVSAPSYPFAALDPVGEVAAALPRARDPAARRRVHRRARPPVLAGPMGQSAAWDFAVPGVTSLSADLHKFGYAPKGVSVLLQRGRDRQRTQYFATTRWPGYPVVNPTILGSKSAGPLAAAWAITEALGASGFAELAASCLRSTQALRAAVDGIQGLRVVGEPVGPLIAVAADTRCPAAEQVDPHHWADAARERRLGAAAPAVGDAVRTDRYCRPRRTSRSPRSPRACCPSWCRRWWQRRTRCGVSRTWMRARCWPRCRRSRAGSTRTRPGRCCRGSASGQTGGLPDQLAPLLAVIEALPAPIAERLLDRVARAAGGTRLGRSPDGAPFTSITLRSGSIR